MTTMKRVNEGAPDSAKELVLNSRKYIKKHKIKSPKPKYIHSINRGKTKYFANSKKHLKELQEKYPDPILQQIS